MPGVVISGIAYSRPATLEVSADTLTWRAVRGFTGVAENIVTTVHDVREAQVITFRVSWAGVVLGAVAALWLATEGLVAGIVGLTAAVAMLGWRVANPRRYLVLEVGANRLVMKLASGSGDAARTLAARIERAIASGEPPATPPMLP